MTVLRRKGAIKAQLSAAGAKSPNSCEDRQMARFTFVTTPDRSRNMAAIRSRGNATTEQRMAQILRSHHLTGWRRHAKLVGHPDFIFPQHKVAIFVDGCFWHGCPRCYQLPKSNRPYWEQKILTNVARDRRSARQLRAAGWRVLRIWEHSLVNEHTVAARVQRALGV